MVVSSDGGELLDRRRLCGCGGVVWIEEITRVPGGDERGEALWLSLVPSGTGGAERRSL